MRIPLMVGLGLILSGASALAQAPITVFSENFDVDPTANWTVNKLGVGNSDANFFFDYSTVGIPAAPNSGATTIGLRLRANQYGSTAAFPSGVSVSPIGQSFSGDYYKLSFDMWLNFNGPAPGGGSGSTQITGAGIGTAGTSAQIAGGLIDSINFGASGEGGTTADYRAYAPSVQSGYQDASGVYAAGTSGSRNNTHAYYAGFGGVSAPAAQVALYPQQTGATTAGAVGWAWRDVEIVKDGNIVTYSIDGLLIATVDTTTAGTLGGGNILFNQYDINSTVSGDLNSPALLFGLIDNVAVMIPEPTSGVLFLLGGLGLFAAWCRRK
ncbi:MAG TPA: PEP-CTERM sorting domain-containing protein [Verrucomicrobiota bacterium]|nr:PEP-CTERM sorting domain-containing protein [Verrucomicrobiota bacterium]